MLRSSFVFLLLFSVNQASATDAQLNLAKIKEDFSHCMIAASNNESKAQSCRGTYFSDRELAIKQIAQKVHENEEVQKSIEKQRLAQQGKAPLETK